MPRHFVCIDSKTMELRRYECMTGGKPKVTHSGTFHPVGDRAREIEAIEFVRKFPGSLELASRLAATPDPYDPEDILWMGPLFSPEGC